MKTLMQLISAGLLLASPALFAGETLPPYHWANSYIDYLKVRGYLPELSVSERPYSRQQLARQLLEIDWDVLVSGSRDRQMIKLLFREFSPEMEMLGRLPDEKWRELLQRALDMLQLRLFPETAGPQFKIGVFGEGAYNYSDQDLAEEFDIDLHPQIGLFWKDHLTLYNNTRVFNNADSGYVGKKYKDLYSYTEQAYIALQYRWVQAKFGRDFLQIGPGRSGQLLFSDNSQPFDMYHFRLGNKFLQFSFWGIALDRMTVTDSTRTPAMFAANRYLNGHRLSLNIKNKFFFGISEAVLYGGPNRGWEFGYMNPAGLYYAHNVNQEPGVSEGNLFYQIDWDLYLFPNWEIYGEFLIDDFQVDNESPGDLEPNELGLIAGVNWANPLGLQGGLFNAEYVQVRNRTYNVAANAWNKYLHRNEVIGYSLGNNFERIGVSLGDWIRPELNLRLFATLVRQGEGSVQGEFNNDFMNYTVEEGYSEPFPFGVVERHLQWGVSAFYKPHSLGHVQVDLGFNDFKNYGNVEGTTFSEFSARFSLWLQWSRLFGW